MMNKYKDFINESKEEDDIYISRLKALVDLALPLVKEAKILYSENSKWKRANEIKRQLNDYWIKIFKFNIDDKPKPTKQEKPKHKFKVGDDVILTKGPFKDFYGKINGHGTGNGLFFIIDKLYSPDGKTTRTLKGIKEDSLEFFKPKEKPKPKPKEAKRNSTADLIVGNKYSYEPDKDTYGKYRTMKDKQVVLMDINRKIRTMSDTIDSFNKARCNYLISIIGAGRNGINKFWTRRECLKHIPYKK